VVRVLLFIEPVVAKVVVVEAVVVKLMNVELSLQGQGRGNLWSGDVCDGSSGKA
jgi:hypothetical protein